MNVVMKSSQYIKTMEWIHFNTPRRLHETQYNFYVFFLHSLTKYNHLHQKLEQTKKNGLYFAKSILPVVLVAIRNTNAMNPIVLKYLFLFIFRMHDAHIFSSWYGLVLSIKHVIDAIFGLHVKQTPQHIQKYIPKFSSIRIRIRYALFIERSTKVLLVIGFLRNRW